MPISEKMVNFVKKEEGFRSEAYWDVNQWSYGYGQKAPSERSTISETQASAQLSASLNENYNYINKKYSEYNFNQNQLDSLSSFSYNLGKGSIAQLTNNGSRSKEVIGNKMTLYNTASGKTLPGLVERRKNESKMFKTPVNEAITEQSYESMGVEPPTIPPTIPPAANNAADAGIASGATVLNQNPTVSSGNNEPLEFNVQLNQQPNSDDATTNPVVTADINSNSVFEAPYSPRPNLFKQFSTMTYTISLYLLSSEAYKNMMLSGTKTVKGLTLFIQSGGITNNTGNFGAVRSKFFDKDYYIDNFQLKSFVSGTSTMSAHNSFELNFTITEPAGITFFENLHGMVSEVGAKNYVAQNYLAVIRFYGYDKNGNQIMSTNLKGVNESLSDPSAVGEKYVPFQFTGITFRLTDDKIEYSCKAVCPNSLIPNDKVHGTIKSDMILSGTTLDDVFNGHTLRPNLGLTAILNHRAIKTAHENTYSIPDHYEIEFEPDIGFENMKILQKGTQYLSTTGMTGGEEGEPLRLLNKRITVNLDKKELAIKAGTSIPKIIDVILQSSEYITDQYKNLTDPATQKVSLKDLTEKDFIWFKIRTEVEQIGWDKWRNDYAYNIKYVISRYKFTSESDHANKMPKECFSIHKEYNFWFTGQNTEVLDFHQDYNYLWYSSISQEYNEETDESQIENNLRTIQRRSPEYNTTGSTQYGTNDSTKISANIASLLYSPADQAMVAFTIVGDPDFLCQSELYYSPTQILNDPEYREAPFLKDGSVNYDISEVYFTMNYNTVVDYDLNTGLANTIAKNLGYDEATGQPGVSNHSLVYRANIITTNLAKGKFTQVLEGTMKPIQPECTMKLKLPDIHNRREDPNTAATTARYAVSNNTGDMTVSPVYNGGGGDDNTSLMMPSNSSLNTVNNPNSNGDDEFNITHPDFLDEYIHSDDNGYSVQGQSVNPSSQPPPVNEFKDYGELASDEEGRNIFERTINSSARFTRSVWTDIKQFGGNAGATNEDDT